MCIVHDITDYLPDGGDSFREKDEGDPVKNKIRLSQERLKKAHGYSSANSVVKCTYEKDKLHLNEDNEEEGLLPDGKDKVADPHPPHTGPCSKCGKKAGDTIHHGLDRTDLAKAVAKAYLAQIRSGADPLMGGMTDHEIPGKMAGVLVCVDPASGQLKVIKAHSGPGLGKDFAELACYAEMLEREDADTTELAAKRKEHDDLPATAKLNSRERKAIFKPAIAADTALTDLAIKRYRADTKIAKSEDKRQRKQDEKDERARVRQLARDTDEADLAPDPSDDPATREMKEKQLAFKRTDAAQQVVLDGMAQREVIEKRIGELEKKQLVGTFRDGTVVDIAETCIEKDGTKTEPEGNCGVCAAPKLLRAAQTNGLVPVSMAEFWVGEATSGGWKEGAYIDSCVECMKFVGTMMCGIDAKNTAATSDLDGKLT